VTHSERIPIALTSAPAAAVNGPAIHVDSNPVELHIILAPTANISDLEGSLDGVNWVNLTYVNAAGAYSTTALAAVGAGYYIVHERPKYVRYVTNADAGGAQDYYAVLIVKKDD
jgi:hypothetical protein